MATMLDPGPSPAFVLRPPPNWVAQALDWLRRRFDREARLIVRYHKLVAQGERYTPGVLLQEYRGSCPVISPPTVNEARWLVRTDEGQEILVWTREIVDLDACRVLDGYV